MIELGKLASELEEIGDTIRTMSRQDIVQLSQKVKSITDRHQFENSYRANSLSLSYNQYAGITPCDDIFNASNSIIDITLERTNRINCREGLIVIVRARTRHNIGVMSFTVALKQTYSKLNIDQIYFTYGGDNEYSVTALGSSFQLNPDKHPEWFLSKENLSYAILLDNNIITHLPRATLALGPIVNLIYTVDRMTCPKELNFHALNDFYDTIK